jgi:DNA-binding NarL/FixJ family response regulator
MGINVVLTDDHPVVLRGLASILEAEDDFKILALCSDGGQALNAVRKYKPDILLLDIGMPGKDGLMVLRELRAEGLSTTVVLLTAELNEGQLAEAVSLQVRGLLLKELAGKLIVQCLRKVHAGELWLEKRSAGMALERLLQGEASKLEAAQVLTRREIEIVKLVAAGLRNVEVAKQLFISEGTVKMHLHNIYEKLNMDSRIKLSRYAQQKNLI